MDSMEQNETSVAVDEINAEIVEEVVTEEVANVVSPKKTDQKTEGKDWETQSDVVGLESIQSEVVLETERLTKTPELSESQQEAALPNWNNQKAERGSKIPTPIKEGDSSEINFTPVLVSSAKIREATKSTGYGKSVVGRKPPKPLEQPTFTPNMNVGKGTDTKRLKSAGSQYGKAVPKKKVLEAPKPSFTPTLVDSSPVTKSIRAKAISKIYDSQKKAAEKGKLARMEHEKRLKETASVSRYTLAKDTSPAPEPQRGDGRPPMVLDGAAVSSLDHEYVTKSLLNHHIIPPDVVRSKFGEKLLSKAVSHYSGDTYKLPKGVKAEKKLEPQWKIDSKATALPSSELVAPERSVKHANAISNYGKDYAPPKSARPETPKDNRNLNLNFNERSSPLNLSASDLPGVRKLKLPVSSSGYGVVSPTPSVPKKVESYKHRGATDLLRTKGARDASSLSSSDTSTNDAEKENPPPTLDENSSALVDDLLNRAAMQDPKSVQSIEKKSAVLSEDNGAVEIASPPEGDEDTQLTML